MSKRFYHPIMRILTRRDYQPLTAKNLAKALYVSDELMPTFQQAIEQMLAAGTIASDKNHITLPGMDQTVTGTYSATSKGFGFVRPEKPCKEGDLFIPAEYGLDAISGDTVKAKRIQQGKRLGQMRYIGRITEVITRQTDEFAGTVFKEKNIWFVQPEGKNAPERIIIEDPTAKKNKIGDKVIIQILNFPNNNHYASGVITENLGISGSDQAELKAIIHRYNLEEKFSRSTLNDTKAAVNNFDPQKYIDQQNYEDIRNKNIITIDPASARDFDDAISLEVHKDYYLLGVHIADVSSFVQPNTHLDKQARQRSTSVYLPGTVVPMLPEILSNGLCSLQPEQPRLAKSVYIKLDHDGKVLKTRFANSIIASTQRLTYEDVDKILDGQHNFQLFNGQKLKAPTTKLVNAMTDLARVIEKRRQAAGMLELEMPRAQLIFDDNNQVVDVEPESNTFSHSMIEMFMLEANEAVARLLDSLQVPFIRRVHDDPNALTSSELSQSINLCGYTIPKSIDRKSIQQLLQAVKGTPESFPINLAVLRSLQKAVYSPVPVGHYALASEHYCHFTSPIRRYPDLTVHRLIDAYIKGKLNKKTIDKFPDFDETMELAEHCSKQERNAESAENDLHDFKILQLLEKHIGNDLDGTVVSITNFGLFVQLDKYLLEGLLKAEDVLKWQIHQQTKGKRRIKGANSNKFIENNPFKLGHRLKIRLADVNLLFRTVDLTIAPEYSHTETTRKKRK